MGVGSLEYSRKKGADVDVDEGHLGFGWRLISGVVTHVHTKPTHGRHQNTLGTGNKQGTEIKQSECPGEGYCVMISNCKILRTSAVYA